MSSNIPSNPNIPNKDDTVNKSKFPYNTNIVMGKSKNKKKKTKVQLQNHIDNELAHYMETKDQDVIVPVPVPVPIPNLGTNIKYPTPKKSLYKNSSVSKSLTNIRAEEIKRTIRKNQSWNLIENIIITPSLDVDKVLDVLENDGMENSLKKSKNKKSQKYDAPLSIADENRYAYLIGDDEIDDVKVSTQVAKPKPNKINIKPNNSIDYHLISTPFKIVGEELINDEIDSKYKTKYNPKSQSQTNTQTQTNAENTNTIRKLKETFKKLVVKEFGDKPNISEILLDTETNDELKIKILRKYIKFVSEDEIFSNESDKIKMEINNLIKHKKVRPIDDYEELRKTVEQKYMPEKLKTKLENMFWRVIDGEQPKLYNLVENILSLPYEPKPNILDSISSPNTTHEQKVQFIQMIYSKLNADLYGLDETKDSIIGWICQKINNPSHASSKYLCLCGPAGVGKTSIVHSISEALQIPYSYISLANIDEPSSLIGHGFTYEGSQCGSVASGLIKNGCTNGILLFDEVDKTKEKVQNTLLGIFDPLQNTKFKDAYFGDFYLDLSQCMMILCLNDLEKINPILKDRLHIVNIGGYTEKDKKNIVYKYTIPRLKTQYNADVAIDDKVIDKIIGQTKSFAGVRQLQMYIVKIFELVVLDKYTMKYNFNGVFGMEHIKLLKLPDGQFSHLDMYI